MNGLPLGKFDTEKAFAQSAEVLGEMVSDEARDRSNNKELFVNSILDVYRAGYSDGAGLSSAFLGQMVMIDSYRPNNTMCFWPQFRVESNLYNQLLMFHLQMQLMPTIWNLGEE